MKKAILLSLVSILFFACDKNKDCERSGKYEGLIVASINGPSFSSECAPILYDTISLFRSVADLDSINGEGCVAFEGIDFDQHSVIGALVGSYCYNVVDFKVTRDTPNMKYILSIEVLECKGCEDDIMRASKYWFTVPTIPANWDLEVVRTKI